MSFDHPAIPRFGRRAPKRFAFRALAIGATSALVVLSFPAAAFAVGAPAAPAKPTVVTGNAAATVSFVAPADNGSAITGYTVTCTSSTGGATGSNTGAASSITVSSLTNAATYTCTVHATNINGNSGESPASDALVVGAPSKPAQPTVTHGVGSISVAFAAPATNGSAIQFFTADCSSSDGGTEGITSDTASPILVTGLGNGNTYTCTVNATNGNGTGVASVPSASAIPASVPGAPASPSVTRGDTQISVAFVAPANNGSAITSYTATCTSSNGGAPGSQVGASSALVVTGLTNGKTYTCRVIATNAEGDSNPSSASSAAVPATVPSAPAQPTIVYGAASISVTFSAPANGGSTITGYTAACASSDGGVSGSNTGTVSPIVVSSLTNGKTYTCTVHATNAVGSGSESAASASTVPAAKPSAPAAPTVTRGNGQISVAFVAPAANGSTITGYTAACTSSDGGVFGNRSGGTSPIVVSSLTNGKTYTCTVFATNGEGDGAPSAASATAVPATLPGAPAQPVLTHGNALISVAFSAPSDGGNAITGYTANCTSSDGGAAGSNTGSSSPIVVSDLTNGKTYTCTVFATNSTGDGSASIASASTVPATVPGTPAQPTVTHGNASISVAFSAPGATGGSAITGYGASCTSSNGGAAGSNTGSSSPIVVSGLTNGKTYTCVVHAINAEGSGSDSTASASTIPATVPSAPAAPTISAAGTTITVAFVAPATGGSAITGYSVSCVSSNGGDSGSNTGSSSTIDVTGLTLGRSYTCTVHATNAEGAGPDSLPSSAATVPAVAPSTPAQPTVTRGASAISVAFVAPFDGGATITGYTATCISSDGGATGSNSGATSPVVVPSLTNGKTYTCKVFATNSAGDSSASVASAAVVPAAVPNAPAAPTVTRGNALISVAFVAPAGNGSTISGYTATCTSSDDGASNGSNTGSSSPIVVSSLTNGSTYTCTVFATNAVGDGLASAASASTVPATTPDAPAQPTATRGNTFISVAFVAPANGGSAITGYAVSCTSSDGGASGSNTGSSSPIVVSSLTNGKTYTCVVHATNAVGAGSDSIASASTVPATTPTAPAKPTTVAAATHITVSFLAPATGGSAITGYTVTCTSSDGGAPGFNTGVSSPIAVQSLSKGNTYTCTVHATNAAGDSSESPASNATLVPATVPDAPDQPAVTPGNGQISVAFGAPDDGGSPITGYSANCTSSDGGAPGAHSGGSSPIVVTGLDNGSTYTCTVLATNTVGDSDASVVSDTTVPATVPGTPAAPTLTRGDASISVAFAAPESDGGSAIIEYTASCASSDGGAAGLDSAESSPIVVSSLTNGKTYTCTVFATNEAGDGNASAASSSAVPATVPDAPAAPTLTHGNASISVAFVAPANGGSAITEYTASCTSSDDGASNGSNTGSSSPILVSSLTNGKTYTCTVLATNVVGGGDASNASSSTVPATVPGTPAAPTLVRGNGTISVAFVAPANGGSAITGYTATCTSSDGGASGNNTGSSSPIVVSSLTNAKTYTCVVHATNVEGDGIDSDASASTGPATSPAAPAQPTTVAGNSRLSVSFVAPATGNSAITGYTVSCTSSNGGVAGNATAAGSSIIVSGLTNAKMYTCTVHATNALGDSAESVMSTSMKVGLLPSISGTVTITGTLANGQILTMHGGTWSGSQPLTYVRKWQRCASGGGSCFKIPGQTGHTYKLQAADVHHTIRAVLTVTNPLGTVVVASVPTSAIRW